MSRAKLVNWLILIVIPLTFLAACSSGTSSSPTQTQYAYVTDGGSGNNIYQCPVNNSGNLSNCNKILPNNITANWSPGPVTFATVNGIKYAYVIVESANIGSIYQCTLNANGTFNICHMTPTLGAPTSWEPADVVFATFNGIQYAYVADYTGNIYQCNLKSDGNFNVCSLTPAVGAPTSWTPLSLTFATVNHTQYLYVSELESSVYKCSINIDGTLHTCNVSATSATPTNWHPSTTSIAAFDGVEYAYVTSINIGIESATYVYQCTLTESGDLNTCLTTPTAAPTWRPSSLAFATFGGVQYAYVTDLNGNVFQCGLNANGTLNICTTTPAIGAPSWQPYAITFSAF